MCIQYIEKFNLNQPETINGFSKKIHKEKMWIFQLSSVATTSHKIIFYHWHDVFSLVHNTTADKLQKKHDIIMAAP